jgi:N4-(beta-N-acetylglucosaminyl)-L-asparaginase
MKRSDFLKTLGLGAVGALTSNQLLAAGQPVASDGAAGAKQPEASNGAQQPEASSRALAPMSIGTWPFAEHTTRAALEAMKKGANALDAVELGVKICEADPRERSVGLGGRPDRDGRVTLDACIMDHLGNIGSVAACEQVVHVSSLARAVMERTPHVMLVGDGATQFAREQGFPLQNLLVAESEAEWKKWLEKSEYKAIPNIENHDTIGQLTLDAQGRLAGCCTTSGMAFKMHGRVGDSPIIGAGLYVDGEVGAATATGHGEEVIRTVGSFRVVTAMKSGKSPQQACEDAVHEIHKLFVRRGKPWADTQIGFIAMDVQGRVGGYALRPGFSYALAQGDGVKILEANSLLDA